MLKNTINLKKFSNKVYSNNNNSNIIKNVKKEIILSTEYGRLSVLFPFLSNNQRKLTFSSNSNTINNNSNIINNSSITHRSVSYIDNNSSSSSIFALINRQKDYFLFKPESHYFNCITIFNSLKKKVQSNFTSKSITKNYNLKNKSIKNAKNKTNEDNDYLDVSTTLDYNLENQKNPFSNCKNPKEIFNLNRNIKLQIKKELSRFGVKLFKSGELDIKHYDNSFLKNNSIFEELLRNQIKKHEDSIKEYNNLLLNNNYNISKTNDIKFKKNDYFISIDMLEGIVTALKNYNKGFSIKKVLGEKKIYPLPGVFNPTREDYLELLDSYLKDNTNNYISKDAKALDIGCGSGVLSFVLANNGYRNIHSIDNNESCILSTKNNAETLGFYDSIKSLKLDILQDITFSNLNTLEINNNSNNLKNADFIINNRYDLIVINPPWLNASYLFSQTEFENAVYDPEYKFLKSSVRLASKY